MNIFKKKSLCAALAGIGALGAAGAAQAVNLNPDGLGQVLIYPYYTVRADANGHDFNSLLSVVNTTASVKAVKVRILEGRNSVEVLDFNLYLSPKDVWAAAITPTADGAGGQITSPDKSCTLPLAVSQGQTIAFRNTAYTTDGAGSSLDRTKEGYVEIIEMATYADSSTTAINATHVNGVPPGCNKITDAAAGAQALPPTGGLFGGMTLINVDSGSDYTADAVALDNFSDVSNYSNAGSLLPTLEAASPPVSVVINTDPVQGGIVYRSDWTGLIATGAGNPADPVSAVLMHDHIMNEYVLDAVTNSGTDWVVTMPTKRFYVRNGTGTPDRLFQRNFNKTDGACDDVDLNIYDREENTTSTPLDFSPPPPSLTNALCWEANVITFNNSHVLGSSNESNITTPADFEHGWLDLGFFPSTVSAPIHTLPNDATDVILVNSFFGTPGVPATYVGLPVVGFAVQSFANGVIQVGDQTVLSNYGGNFIHKGTRLINAPFATAP
ncbi:MAG: hypothetical protein ACM3SX_20730 [Deltaproteobacteria bacterium]|jgi:hypothetical protein